MSISGVYGSSVTSTADVSGSRLRKYNLVVGLVHLIQGIVILLLSNNFTLPIQMSFIDGPPGTAPSAPASVWNVRIGIAVAVFLLFAAADHLLMAAPGVNAWYMRNLHAGINRARWSEYSMSASLMMVLIAMVTGILDLTALIAIFGANMAMIFFGLVMEAVNKPDRANVNWWPFIFGSIVGAVPWIAIFVQLVYTEQHTTGAGIPGFVYGIIASLFLCFNSFAINMVLQYKKVGPWRSYEFGERAYIVLSLVAKTLLAWQIFANTLV